MMNVKITTGNVLTVKIKKPVQYLRDVVSLVIVLDSRTCNTVCF